MGKLKIMFLIILLGFVASAGSGQLFGQAYTAYPLNIYGELADIAADNSNNLHIIWIRYGTMYYGRIVNNAVTGTQTVPNTEGLVAIHWSWPHIAKSPSGDTVHVLWVGRNYMNLFHSWRNTAGTWTTETVRTSTYNQFYWPVCSVDAAGNVHAVYGNSPGDGNCDVFYSIKNTSGSWSTPVEISGGDTHLNTTNPDFNEQDMFSDVNGGIHVKWSLINTKYLRYRYCASGGSLASSPTQYMADNSAISVGPGDIYVENNGTVHLGFNAYSGTVNMDHSYKLAGGSWSAPTRARSAANPAHEIWPSIAVPRDGSNRVFMAWAEGTSLVKMAIKDSGNWTLYDIDTAAGMNDDWIRPAMTATDSAICGIWRTGAASSYSWVLGVIPTKTITLTTPNGGESWQAGTTKEIAWSGQVDIANIKIELSADSSGQWSTIVASTPNDGSYDWDIRLVPALNCFVRVSDVLGTVSDTSDGPFVLTSPPSQTGNSFQLPVNWTEAGNGADGWYIGDYNGDGRSDLLRYVPGVSGGQVFLSDGTQFVYGGSWTGASNGTDGWYVGDYNGDGRSDLLRYVPGESGGQVFLSDGTQFVYAGSWTGAGNGGNGWYVADYNGDGRGDLMRYVLYMSGADMLLAGSGMFDYDGSWTPAGKGDEDWYLGDFNGDGRGDLMRYLFGISGGEVLLSTAKSSGSASSAKPLAGTEAGEKGRWLGDVPANPPLSAEELSFVQGIKARIASGEDISIYRIQRECEKLTGKWRTRAGIMKLLKPLQWDLEYKLKQQDLLK